MNCKAGGRTRLDSSSGSSGFGLNPLLRLGRSFSIPCSRRRVRRIQAAEICAEFRSHADDVVFVKGYVLGPGRDSSEPKP